MVGARERETEKEEHEAEKERWAGRRTARRERREKVEVCCAAVGTDCREWASLSLSFFIFDRFLRVLAPSRSPRPFYPRFSVCQTRNEQRLFRFLFIIQVLLVYVYICMYVCISILWYAFAVPLFFPFPFLTLNVTLRCAFYIPIFFFLSPPFFVSFFR